MGTVVPIEWPEINPAKFYQCTVNRYTQPLCVNFLQVRTCCQPGADVIDHIDNDKDCTNGGVCVLGGIESGQLLNVVL